MSSNRTMNLLNMHIGDPFLLNGKIPQTRPETLCLLLTRPKKTNVTIVNHLESQNDLLKKLAQQLGIRTGATPRLSPASRIRFYICAIFGMVNNALGGFNGMAAISSLFTNNLWIIIPPALIFALINAIIFVGFDFSQVASRLGIQAFTKPPILTLLLEQKEQLESLCQHASELAGSTDLSAQKYAYFIFKMLNQQWHEFKSIKAQWQAQYYLSTTVKRTKQITGYMCTLLFLFCGYFNGQSGALFILGISNITVALSNPITASIMIGIGILSAMGAASFYLFLQRHGVESLVSKLMGYDQEAMQTLCDRDRLSKLESTISLGLNAYSKPTLPVEDKAIAHHAHARNCVDRNSTVLTPTARYRFFNSGTLAQPSSDQLREIARPSFI